MIYLKSSYCAFVIFAVLQVTGITYHKIDVTLKNIFEDLLNVHLTLPYINKT